MLPREQKWDNPSAWPVKTTFSWPQVTHSEIYLHREKVCSRQARGPPEPADPPSSSGQRHSCYTLSALFLHGSPPATAEWRTSPCSLTCSKAEKKESPSVSTSHI